MRLANIYDLFEKSSSREESIVDGFYVKAKSRHELAMTDDKSLDDDVVVDLSADVSDDGDDEYVNSVIDKGNYMKYDTQSSLDENGGEQSKKSKTDTSIIIGEEEQKTPASKSAAKPATTGVQEKAVD